MSQGVLDTSVVIALAHVALPEEASAISIVTLCELHTGVLVADDARRPERLATLVMAENTRDRDFVGLDGVEVVLA